MHSLFSKGYRPAEGQFQISDLRSGDVTGVLQPLYRHFFAWFQPFVPARNLEKQAKANIVKTLNSF